MANANDGINTIAAGFKNVFLAGVGAMALTGEKTKELVDQLVAKGEITVEQGKQVTTELQQKAAEAANAAGFIEEFPEKYDTLAGERGARLSGGQIQRIAIARAILKDAPILLLDEATSALDVQAETDVQKALDELTKGRTTFVVAHRLSTIKNADYIVVVEHGKVVEGGTHEELMEHGSVYPKLYSVNSVLAEKKNF